MSRRSTRISELIEDKDWLEEKYVTEKCSQSKIAEILGCSQTTVCIALKNFGLLKESKNRNRYKELSDKSWLKDHYIDEKLSGIEIAEKLECHNTAVYKALDKFGIKGRTFKEAQRVKNPTGFRIIDSPKIMNMLYNRESLSAKSIGRITDTSCETVNRYLDEYGIEKRSQKEAHRLAFDIFRDRENYIKIKLGI